MKKSLLLLAFAVVATVGNVKAQTTWDFSSSAWPINAGETSATIKKLKSKKKYYVRMRTYKVVNGKKVYSAWSKAKSVKVK